jgi:hypothetical protein
MISLFAQPATPPTPVPTVPTSGDFWNPANWATAIHELGIVGFLLIMFVAIALVEGWLLLKQRGQPSNAEQVAYLKAMYRASNVRDSRIAMVMRAWARIVGAIADKGGYRADVKSDLDKISDTLDGPPPVPSELLKVTDEV